VKIEKDPLIETKVLTQVTSSLSTEVVGGVTIPFHFLADKHNKTGLTQTTGNDNRRKIAVRADLIDHFMNLKGQLTSGR